MTPEEDTYRMMMNECCLPQANYVCLVLKIQLTNHVTLTLTLLKDKHFNKLQVVH